ncbi:MAG: choice-of-anchor D domain-containing protein [Terriglobales bacterium]
MYVRCRRSLLITLLLLAAATQSAHGQSATLAPTSLSFGSVALGSMSATKTVTLTNGSKIALSVSSITASGDFAQSNTCGSSVAAKGSCKLTVTFQPTATGARRGSVTITDNARTTTQTINLTGTGIAQVTVSPLALAFGSVALGTTTPAKTITVDNNQTTAMTISVGISGDYAQTNTCGTQLGAGASCAISVTFTPTASGARTGQLRITDSAATSPQTVALSGSGSGSLTVTSIAITPANPTVTKGAQQPLTATATYSNGTTQNVTASAAWTSSNAAVATVSNGVVTAVAAGSATITATVSGSTVKGTTVVTVAPAIATLVSITLTSNAGYDTLSPPPRQQAVPLGYTAQYAATGTFSDGTTQDITKTVTWSSSNPAVVTISNTAPTQGQATPVSQGRVYITAVQGSIQSSIILEVFPPTATSVVVTPANPTMVVGTNQQFHLMATFSDGVTRDVTGQATWSSSGGVVFINGLGGGGLATASITGTSTVTGWFQNCAPWGCGGMGNTTNVTVTAAATCPTQTIDMKVLVVNNSANNYLDFQAIQQILNYLGTPYDVVDVANGITAAMLSDGACHGYYQGVIFAVGDDIDRIPGMSSLTTYEQNFGVRQVNWYTFPSAEVGLNSLNGTVDSGGTYTASFTPAAASVFYYANTSTPLTFTRSYIYLATPATVSTGSVTPLLVDSLGNALSLIYDMGDGRQYLTQTFDSNPDLTHDQVLAYGLINWVTKGIFLGEYHVYAAPQVDDIFMQNDEWQATTPCPNSNPLPQYRLSGSDWDNVVAWQNTQQQNPLLSNFVMQFAFVGSGATGDSSQGGFNPDTLTPEVELYKANFHWLSHTWDHQLLDTATAGLTDYELLNNDAEAVTLGLPGFNPANLVTPAITGLNNPAFVNEAVADGVRNVVTDTTVIGQPNNGPNPSPNVGIVNSYNSSLYEVPRHATNLFYNVGIPNDWVAEYQCIYAGEVPYDTFTYQQILDNVSHTLLSDMLIGDMDPQMYHESNLHNYDGLGHTLLTDLYDETFNTYFNLFNLPVLSPTLDGTAQNMQNRNAYNLSRVTASLVGVGGTTPTISLTVPATADVPRAIIPVTGLNSTGAEVYGGRSISHITVNQGQTITLPVQ